MPRGFRSEDWLPSGQVDICQQSNPVQVRANPTTALILLFLQVGAYLEGSLEKSRTLSTPLSPTLKPTEVHEMNNDDRENEVESEATSNAPPTDTSGKPVNVVKRDLQDANKDNQGVDETITPSSTRTKEQDAEELNRKTAEIERKIADGN
jgi:hypothetical protein